ncbi:hypothetical protein GMO_02560 [Gluconobacter morbifer G707]|uniref:Uncharacterized protein n=1 Tax=Gluconobacter morbifer G707 TaxID=1088869 RepID=G6XFJ1_9PROT|nr:hypothetical protein GMO_02560 [Gluconobacter morbifer G707]
MCMTVQTRIRKKIPPAWPAGRDVTKGQIPVLAGQGGRCMDRA